MQLSFLYYDLNFAMNPSSVGNTFYEEINQENGTKFKCLICHRTLSRKQRVEDHLRSLHSIGEKMSREIHVFSGL